MSLKISKTKIYGEIVSAVAIIISFLPILIPIFIGEEITVNRAALSIILYIVTEKFTIIFREFNSRNYFEDKFNQIKNIMNVEYVGVKENAVQEILNKADEIIFLRNTHFTHDADMNYSPDGFKVFGDALEIILKRGGHVKDLYGSKDPKDPLEQHSKLVQRLEKHPRHSAVRYDTNIPVLNFLIIEYRNQAIESEVYFGWGAHLYDQAGDVFKTNDPKIVSLFDKYFTSMTDASRL